MAPKGSFPASKPDGSFPSRYDVFMTEETFSTIKPTKPHLTLSKSIKMMNSCFKETGRAVYPMHGGSGGYKNLYTTKDKDNDALPLLEHVESQCEEPLDFIGGGVATH